MALRESAAGVLYVKYLSASMPDNLRAPETVTTATVVADLSVAFAEASEAVVLKT